MPDILKALLSLQLGYFLVVVGVIFLLVAAIGKIREKIDPGTAGRIFAGVVGIILIIGGLVLSLFFRGLTPCSLAGCSPTPTSSVPHTPPLTVVVRPGDGPQDRNTAGSATASCQGNEVMVGGGYTETDPQTGLVISANYPSSKNSWSVSYSLYQFNLSFGPRPSPTPRPLRVLARAYAVCVSFSRSIETIIVPGAPAHLQGPGPAALPDAKCPSGYTLLSGGYTTPFDQSNIWTKQGWAIASYPSSSLAWHVTMARFGRNAVGDYQAYALCGKGTMVEQSTIASNPFSVPGNQVNRESASCASDQLASGGGYQLDGSFSSFGSDEPQGDTHTQWAIDFYAQSGTVYAVCIQLATT